jgi:hypothetical protein
MEMGMLMDISEHNTEPIPLVPAGSAFHTYLTRHRLTWINVARTSGVRALTVWCIDHGRPVHPLQAAQVRRGLYLLTGEQYTGPIAVIKAQEPPRRQRGRRKS